MSEKLKWKGDKTECHRWRIQTTRERNGTKWETYYTLEVSESASGGPMYISAPGEGNKLELKRKAQQLMDGEDWYSAMYGPPEWLTSRRLTPKGE